MSHRDPVLVASYPKSGRTWLTVLLGKAIADTCGLPDRDLFKLFKESGPPRKAAKCMPAMWFSHDGTQFDALMMPDDLKRDMSRYQSKVIVLVREPKDVLVSHYFQLTQRRFFEGETGASAKEKHSALKTMSRNDFCERAGIRLQDGEITMGAFLR
ncbi:MAG: hypothetical protein KDA20_05145, partial [Phycisphaerales bacterium]|nr:hypothetical protein [Phycisphaerales bacterium]